MNNKGDLLKNLLGLVIAVIGLLLIFGVAYRIYQVNVNQESENAKELIGVLEEKINLIEEGETARIPVRGPGQEDSVWYLIGWSRSEESRPDKCFFESCLCICEHSNDEACQGRNGFCENFDEVEIEIIGEAEEKTKLYISTGPYSVLKGTGEFIYHPYVILPSNLAELEITKQKDKLIIKKNEL